jgi:hypothetical protein
MRAVALSLSIFASLFVAGCLDADVDNGILVCSSVPGRACPHGYYCAYNNFCYHDGKGPGTTPPPDMTFVRDLSFPVVEDLARPAPTD